MKKLLLTTVYLCISLIIFAQGQIKLVPVDYNEQDNHVKRLKTSIKPGPNDRIEFSKNKENVVLVDHIEGMGLKGYNKIVKLYDKSGRLLAASDSLDLYDWEVKPLGDDETVLVIFPAGTAREAVIKIYKKFGNNLKETNSIFRKTLFFKIDISMNGNFFVCGFSEFNNVSNKPEIKLYNDLGELLWSNFIDETRFYQVAISKNYIVGASKDSDNKRGFIYLYDYQGKNRMKDKIDSHIGNYNIKFSNYNNDNYLGISTLNNIYLFDSEKKIKIKKISSDKDKEISSYVIDKKGNIIFTVMNKRYSKEMKNFEISNQELIINDLQNRKRTIKLGNEGEPVLNKEENKIFLKMSNNKKEKYYEIQY